MLNSRNATVATSGSDRYNMILSNTAKEKQMRACSLDGNEKWEREAWKNSPEGPTAFPISDSVVL